MKTYWFTIVSNPEYEQLYQDLRTTAQHHDIEIHAVTTDPSQVSKAPVNTQLSKSVPASTVKLKPEEERIKRLKIEAILNAPSGYERIVYLDADTLLVDPSTITEINASMKEPWPTQRALLPQQMNWLVNRRWQQRLWPLLKKEGLETFCPGGTDYRQEWNSGVIVGDRKFMEALAQAWLRWWLLLLDICEGNFERDLISYIFANSQVARHQNGFETISPRYNCIVKRMGFLPDAAILHRAGLPKGNSGLRYRQVRQNWAIAKQTILDNHYQSWARSIT